MAHVRLEVLLPCIKATGLPGVLQLEDFYNVGPGLEWDIGDTFAALDTIGTEYQWLMTVFAQAHKLWLLQCYGFISATEGDTSPISGEGEISYGTPA